MNEARTKRLLVCVNRRPNPTHPSCAARGSAEIADELEIQIAAQGLDVTVERIVCLAHCDRGPALRLAGEKFILGAELTDVPEIIGMLAAE